MLRRGAETPAPPTARTKFAFMVIALVTLFHFLSPRPNFQTLYEGIFGFGTKYEERFQRSDPKNSPPCIIMESWLESVHRESRITTGTLRSFLVCDMISKLFVLKGLERSTTAVQESVFGAREPFGNLERRNGTTNSNREPQPFSPGMWCGTWQSPHQKPKDDDCHSSGQWLQMISVSFELDLAKGRGQVKKLTSM